MKVLMLSWELPPVFTGGLGVACEGIANDLSNRVDLKVIVPCYSSEHSRPYKVVGLNNAKRIKRNLKSISPVECLPYHSQLNIDKAFFLDDDEQTKSILDNGGLYEDVTNKVREYTQKALKEGSKELCDVIYAHDWLTALAGVELRKKLRKPLVLHVHSLEYDRSGGDVSIKGGTYKIERYAMIEADRVVVVSEYTATVCKFHYGIDPSKITVIHNGVVKNRMRRKPIKKNKRREVVFLGRLTEQKGPYNFLKIAKKVLEKNPKARFTMAGSGEELGGLMEEGVKKVLKGNVRFTGFLDKNQVEKLLDFADVYCMPSISEPFGLSALEAVQQGVPVVISNQSGVSEVLSGAVRIDYWEIQKMANGINELLLDDVVYESKLELLSDDIAKLSWSTAVDKLQAVFETVVQENKFKKKL